MEYEAFQDDKHDAWKIFEQRVDHCITACLALFFLLFVIYLCAHAK